MPLHFELKDATAPTVHQFQMHPTVIQTTASTSSIQIRTLPPALVNANADYQANLWSERLFSNLQSSDSDGARFLAGMLEGK